MIPIDLKGYQVKWILFQISYFYNENENQNIHIFFFG